ncbi:MAG: glycosyltransferase family 2 protein [Bacteroidales bacterium]|nr:glycosyltransferase family 2 protein [Bacteroidales bacterium]
MIVVAYIVLIFAVIQLLVALSNLIFRPKLQDKTPNEELVSVIIPARNEEKSIQGILEDLLKQDYSNLEILVFDDESEDQTVKVVSAVMKQTQNIKLIHSGGLAEGWLGKNYACHSAAELARGKYLLFVDADVRLQKTALSKMLHFLKREQSALLSIFPVQTMKTPGEECTVPVMNYILLSLLPLFLVRYSRRPSLSAANGQFMLFEASFYRKYEPHKTFRNNKVEDIEIARFFKKNRLPVSCTTGLEEVSCRMYSGYKEAVYGFSKNIFMFFGNSALLAVLFWLITTFGFLPVVLTQNILWIAVYFSLILLTRVFVAAKSKRNILISLLTLVPEQISMGLMILQALLNKKNNQYQWKSRNIQA